jgi:predicted small lipoprotein YifL
MRRLLPTLLVATVVTGCGLKGPLYLPDAKPPSRQAQKSPPVKPSPAPIEQDTKETTP